MAHAPIETKITEDWVRAQADAEEGILSVGGLAHRVGMLGSSVSPEPGRLMLAKFIELARRERKQSPQELAARAGVDLSDVVALENPEWQSPSAQVIESVAAALDVDSLPLLELGGFSRTESKALVELAIEFAARLEAMKPLEPQELEALSWLRNHAFKSRSKRAEVG